MPSDPDAIGEPASSDASRWSRFSGSIRNFALKPSVAAENATGNRPTFTDDLTTVEEIEGASKRANDKERLIGLLVAPVAAGIGFAVTASLVANDPKALLANGQINPHHVSPNLYVELGLVTMALSLVMLGAAWFRKRLLIGVAAALYGLSLFNLHYWGFGVPYIMIGSWYLVRAYRLSEKLKRAKTDDPDGYRPSTSLLPPSKRYTPPAAAPRRAPKPKRGKELGAG
jgi:hypothetical protein